MSLNELKMHRNWVQKSLENATCHPFGTKSRPGWLQDAQGTEKVLLQSRPFGQKMSLQGRAMAPIWQLKWVQKRDFDARLALGPSKNEFLGVVLENVRNLMKFLCENA